MAGVSCKTTPLSFSQIEAVWIANGGSRATAAIAAAVAMAESGGCTTAVGATNDWGLWQINGGGASQLDANANAKTAIRMSGNGTNWKPWCTAYTDCACGTKGGHFDPFGSSCSGKAYAASGGTAAASSAPTSGPLSAACTALDSMYTGGFLSDSAYASMSKKLGCNQHLTQQGVLHSSGQPTTCSKVVEMFLAGEIDKNEGANQWKRIGCGGRFGVAARKAQAAGPGTGSGTNSTSYANLPTRCQNILDGYNAGTLNRTETEAALAAAACPAGILSNNPAAPQETSSAADAGSYDLKNLWSSFSGWQDALLGVLDAIYTFFRNIVGYLQRFGLIIAGGLLVVLGLSLVARGSTSGQPGAPRMPIPVPV